MAAGAALTALSRCQTDDVVESPPKRVTRARAAKASEEPATDGPVSKKITTASARAAATSKASTTARVSKNTTRKKTEKLVKKAEEKSETTTKGITRARAVKKVEEPVEMELDEPKAPSTRTRRAAATTKESKPASKVTKARTRTTRAADKAPPAEAAEEAKPKEMKRSTRGRPPGAATRATASTATRAMASRKKVTFEDEQAQDKENIPVAVKGGSQKQTATKGTIGIKARPVRRAAPTRSALRSQKAGETGEGKGPTSPQMPLSPKKIHQVAKSWSGSSEDELCEKAPVRALSKSPVKAPLSVSKAAPRASEHTTAGFDHSSPTKVILGSAIKSPAKRPPTSPFKDALGESPKKFKFGSADTGDVEDVGRSLLKGSIKQSPKKASFLASASPARHLQTPLKTSLLASPARRPASHEKAGFLISPGKSTLALPALDRSVELTNANAMYMPTPVQAERSPFQPTQHTSDSSAKVETMPAQNVTEEASAIRDGKDCTLAGAGSPGLTPPGFPESFKEDVIVSDSPKFRSVPMLDESDSEDELVSFHAMKRTPARRTRRSSKYRKSVATPAIIGQGAGSTGELAITPLAVQLSSWLAASPEKQREKDADENGGHKGVFATIGASGSKRESSSSQDSTTTVITSSPKFFADQMAVRDLEAVQVHEDSLGSQEFDDEEMVDVEQADLEAASQSTEQFGDENAMPLDLPVSVENQSAMWPEGRPRVALGEAVLLHDTVDASEVLDENVSTVQATTGAVVPISEAGKTVITPIRRPLRHQEIHTVNRVPLRAGGGRSPLKTLKKRSKSLAHPLATSEVLPCHDLVESVETEQEPCNQEIDEPMADYIAVPGDTPRRPVMSQNPPATMPPKARKVRLADGSAETPLKVQKKRNKSMTNVSAKEGQDPRTYLAPSTSFATHDADDESGDELAEVTTPRVVLSEVPPATMPAKTCMVPLRPEGEVSPIRIPKKRRGKSVGVSSKEAPMTPGSFQKMVPIAGAQSTEDAGTVPAGLSTPQGSAITSPRAVSSPDFLYSTITPAKAVRTGADAQILRGAVVFVDVHTTEGADASGIFIDLLTQMGAKCVKQWTWSLRASSGAGPNGPEELAKNGKVGITHVVFKDGGKRTLQKVREAKGLVLCVGVGWVLE